MIRQKRPDVKNALSIVEAAQNDMKFTLSLQISEQSASTITRNIYESFRKIGDALLVARGVHAKDHVTPIKELLKLQVVTTRPIQLIDNLRKLRHNINYYGYNPSLPEVEDIISLAKSCFPPLVKEVLDIIKSF